MDVVCYPCLIPDAGSADIWGDLMLRFGIFRNDHACIMVPWYWLCRIDISQGRFFFYNLSHLKVGKLLKMHIHIYVCQNKFSALNVKHLRGENNINNITPYAFCLWSTFSDRDLFNKGLWAYHPNLVKVHVAFDWTIPIKSGHNFAHVTTAGLSWHVQSSDPMCLLRSLKALSIVIKFQLRAYNPLRRGSQGAVSIRKTVLPGMAIPMLKIRRPNGRLIFNMEIAIRR